MAKWMRRAVPIVLVATAAALGPAAAAATAGLTVQAQSGDLGPGRTTVAVSGTYSCGPFTTGLPDRGVIDLTVAQVQRHRTVTAYGYLEPAVCDGTDQAFTTTVTVVGTRPFQVGGAQWSASGYVEGDTGLQSVHVPPTPLRLTR